jgi:hypothetical protein
VKPLSHSHKPHEPKKKSHAIIHHAKQPHGIAFIFMMLFIIAWAMWSFVIW